MSEEAGRRKFGAFTGVFTPALLTILGVIMYVRLPWVVGNAGLLGSFAIMGLAMGITLCTGLSLSSIATNTQLGAGGPYALITRSLGLEVGGSIGVPLYLSRPLGIAMYVFGFREGWLWIFPGHEPLLVDLAVFVVLFGIAYLSANLAFRVQYVVMAVIAISLFSIFFSERALAPEGELQLWGQWRGFPEDGFEGADFWLVFAVFFPATTGILAGANMSGELADPRKSIARGTLWAIGISCVVYFGLALWASYTGSPDELSSNYNYFIDSSSFGYGVLAGLLGASFSSALASAVGGPRILMAMGQKGIIPRSEWWARRGRNGEPRNAVALTAVLTFVCLMARDLNVIAPLVTMFFLLTYLMINVVLLIESGLGLVSFRPSLRVPVAIPLIGALGCVFTMFVVNAVFGLVAIVLAVGVYAYISRLGLQGNELDVRSSIFESLAEWAAARVVHLGGQNVRSWKPDVLVPIDDVAVARGAFRLLAELCKPEGSLVLMALQTPASNPKLASEVEQIGRDFRAKTVFARWAVVRTETFATGVLHGLQALQSALFRPNILFLVMPRETGRHVEFEGLLVEARNVGVGVMILGRHSEAGLGEQGAVNLWVRPAIGGWDVDEAFEHNNIDLTVLMGYRLMRRWDASLTLVTAIDSERERPAAEAFLAEICELARLPNTTRRLVIVGPFLDAVASAPHSDLQILGLHAEPRCEFLAQVVDASASSCLFVADSGRESARA